MADALGILSKAAFKKDRGLYGAGPAISYPETPGGTSLAATHQIPFISESITEAVTRQLDKSLVGSGRELPASIVLRDFSGSMESQLSFLGLQRLMMCALGFESPDTSGGSPATLAAGAYCHLFELDESLQDQAWTAAECGGYTPPSANDRKVRRGALGFYKEYPTGGDHVFQSVMINKFTLSGGPTEMKCTWEVIPYGVLKGSYNHANWTLPGSSRSIGLFQQSVVKFGARAGGAGAMTTMAPNSFELTIDNNHEPHVHTTESGVRIIQPVRAGFRSVTYKYGFPRYDSVLESMINAAHDLDTEFATSIEITGPQIGSTGQYYFWGFYSTSVRTLNPKTSIDGPGAVDPEFELVAARPGSTADIFVAGGKYHGIGLKKNSEIVVVTHDVTNQNYLLET